MILTACIGIPELLKRVKNIGDQLQYHTEKLVFSFADISIYRKVENNLKREHVEYIEFTECKMHEFANGLQTLNEDWNFEIGTCAEGITLEQYNIKHNKCVDDDLMIKLFGDDKSLMTFLKPDLFGKSSITKDKGQRDVCGCIISKDIGQYNTCPHGCIYCYANTSKEIAEQNYNKHRRNPHSPLICG